MSGEELKKKLKSAGISQAEIARRLGVVPQSVIQTLEAKDIKSGFIEDLCRVLGKNMSFFYGETSVSQDHNKEIKSLKEQVLSLQEENSKLKNELTRMNDPEHPKKESEVYLLWMEQMKITERMQELYKKENEG